MTSDKRNVPASVHARLLNVSRNRREDFNLTLTRYVAERFLYRLGTSTSRDKYVLKGAMLLTVTLHDLRYRPTRDVDMLRWGAGDLESIQADVAAICSLTGGPDGLQFESSQLILEEIRERNFYHGMRIKVPVTLGSARVVLQIDMGFGDAVHPPPATVTIESLLDLEAPEVLAYPLEAVVAEKFEAMVSIGMPTSRMKDYFDIHAIASARAFDRGPLVESVEATFARRRTVLPDSAPSVLTDAMYDDPAKATQWSAFLRRIGRTAGELPLDRVVARAREFLSVVWDPELADRVSVWTPESGWHHEPV
jgi:hypothetical protein